MSGPAASDGDAVDADGLQRALALAHRYLHRSERTVGETRRYLDRHGVDPTMSERAIGVLTDDGYLSDARFARLFADDKRRLEHWGSDRIRQGLIARGVDAELIDATLAGETPEESELERALELLRRRFPAPARDRRARDRALGVLLRKGYDVDVALEALQAHGSPSDDATVTSLDGEH